MPAIAIVIEVVGIMAIALATAIAYCLEPRAFDGSSLEAVGWQSGCSGMGWWGFLRHEARL